jgi:hypothetical protein
MLVDKVAWSFCAADKAASCPLPAAMKTSGLGGEVTEGCSLLHHAAAWTNSSRDPVTRTAVVAPRFSITGEPDWARTCLTGKQDEEESMRSFATVVAVLVAAVLGAGCDNGSSAGSGLADTSTSAVSHGGAVHDHVSFVDNLRGRGVAVEIVGTVRQPFLRPSGTRLRLTGGGLAQPVLLESYNYDSTDLGSDATSAVTQDAAAISPDGTPKMGRESWTAPAHFFRADRVLVLYVGSDATALILLTDLLGPQFAGQ